MRMVKHPVLFYHPALLASLSGLKLTFEAFLCFALTMSLVSLAGVSLAFLVSASVSTFAMANALIALPFILMMVRRHEHIFLGLAIWISSACGYFSSCKVFGGYLVNLNSMLSWLSWMKWISIFRYGLNVSPSSHIYLSSESLSARPLHLSAGCFHQ